MPVRIYLGNFATLIENVREKEPEYLEFLPYRSNYFRFIRLIYVKNYNF